MIKNTILTTLTIAFSLTASVALAEGTTTRTTVRTENHTETSMHASTSRPLVKLEDRIENRTNASTSRTLLRDRTNASSTKMVDSTCAKTAVDARKASLVSIYAKFTSTLNTSLATREDAIKASFDQTTKKARQEARVSARTAYKKDIKAAFGTLKTSEKNTMKTYSSSIKACSGTSAEANDESSDGSIGDSIK